MVGSSQYIDVVNNSGNVYKGELYLSNQAFSESEDLMLGSGVLYFLRDDDNNKSLHHLGNVEEFTLTTDVTTVEKRSSMNHRRALMASVVTETNPTATITMDEYNPYNLALGLFGTEGVHKQEKVEIKNQPITVTSVPGIIELKDEKGNRYYNVHNVTVSPSAITPASATFTGGAMSTTDPANGQIALTGAYTGSTDETIYIEIKTPCTTAGTDLLGLSFDWYEGLLGTHHTEVLTGGATTETVALGATGLSVTFTISGTDNYTAHTLSQIVCKAATSGFTEGVEYTLEEQNLQAGLIAINDTDKIKVGDTVLVSATVDEDNFITVSGADAGRINGELLFVGDPSHGNRYALEGWKVTVQPNGDLGGLISDGSDFGNFQLTINFLSDYKNHPDCEYYKLTKTGVSSDTNIKKGVYDPHE